jgi:hypothetical protein
MMNDEFRKVKKQSRVKSQEILNGLNGLSGLDEWIELLTDKK